MSLTQDPHMNPNTGRWEFRDGFLHVLEFWYGPIGYVTDRGESLGKSWGSAVEAARKLAQGRIGTEAGKARRFAL